MVAHCKDVKAKLNMAKEEILKVLPANISVDVDKIIQVAYMTFSRTKSLMECSAISVVRCVMLGAQLGLAIDGISNDAHMVAYYNRDIGMKEAQFQLGYRGMIKLMKRHGGVTDIQARAVYKHDSFKCTYGLNGTLEHEPNWTVEQKNEDILGFYAIAFFKDAPAVYEFIPKAEVDKIKGRTKSKDNDGKIYSSSPWVTDYTEMGRKTAIKRLYKYLANDSTLNKAIQWDHQAVMGERQVYAPFDGTSEIEDYPIPDMGNIADNQFWQEQTEGAESNAPKQTKAQKLADQIDIEDGESYEP